MNGIKTKKQKSLTFLLFSLMFLGFFGLNKVENAYAAATEAMGQCYNRYTECNQSLGICQEVDDNLGRMTKESCKEAVKASQSAHGGGTMKWNPVGDVTNTTGAKTETIAKDPGDICAGISLTSPSTWLNCILLIILQFLGMLLAAAATIFNWIIDSDNMKSVIANDIIYSTWAMVRDTLNITFILVLLFSAFSTVFQVDKYSYKNLLRTLVIMALLVNFSYPISRFIIDFSNSIMYYLLNNLGLGDPSTIVDRIADNSKLAGIIKPEGGAATDTVFLLASVIFTWIFTITILIIALLFVIRTVALAILIIFSSLAFTGSIIPFLSKYSSQWWDNLFKYAFFGPVMIFMLSVALKMMSAINLSGMADMKTIAGQQSSTPSIVASIAFFSIPVIILWAGIMFAQSMSLMGASAVINRGKGVANWGVKTFSGAGFAMGAWGAYRSRRKEADKDSWRNRLGTFAGSKQDQLRGILPGRTSRDAELRYQRDMAQKVEAEAKRVDTANMATNDLDALSRNGNKFERAAAIQELANRGRATAQQLHNVGEAFGNTSQVFNQLASKIKAYNPVAAFATQLDNAGNVVAYDQVRMLEHVNSNQFDVKKINADSLNNTAFMETLFNENSITTKDIMDISKSSPAKRAAINTSLDDLVAYRANAGDETDRNIHMARFAQTGEVLDNAFANHVFSTMDKDTASRMTDATITANQAAIAQNVNSGQYKNIIQNMRNNAARKNLNDYMRSAAFAPGSNGANVQRIANTDPFLQNL